MTVFGPDISSFEHGLDLATLPDASFVIAKATEGTYYADADYDGWRRQALQLGRLFVWYHFLSGEDAHAQVAQTLAHVGDRSLPGMLDVETEGTFHPSLAQVLAYADAAHAAGLNLRLVYLPRWYWQQLGSPDLTPLADRGLRVVSSAYPGGSGSAAQLYPGDGAPGWQPYGGVVPMLYQFTDKAADGGKLVDFNAYRGTLPQLAALLSSPMTGGSTVPTIPASIGQKWPDIADQFPAGATFDDSNAVIWADGGARAAALFALQARDAIRELAARVAAPAVDVAALAAALGPNLHPQVDVGALVAELVPQLPGAVDPMALATALMSHIKVA